MARRGEMQQVELLDSASDEDDAQDAGRAAEAARRVRVRRRRLMAGAAIVALTLVVVQWVATARENAAWARLAEVPGVLSPLDVSLDVVRRVPSTDAGALSGVARGELKHGGDGSQTYTWITPAGGGPGWTAELVGPHDAPAITGAYFGGTACQADAERGTDVGTARRLVCLVTDGATLADDSGRLTAEIPASTRQVVVLSTADGAVEARWPLERGQSMAVLPGDAVVVGSATEVSETITAYDALTGAERWTHEDALPAPASNPRGAMAISVFRAGDLVAYSAPSGRLSLLSTEGRLVRDLGDAGTGGSWNASATGAVIVQTLTSGGATRSTFVAADGDPARDVTVDGQVVYTSVDDGSVPGLILTSDTALRAWDARTGAARWSHATYLTTGTLILRGRIYAATDRGVIALDGMTGERLWSREGRDGIVPGMVWTDGRHVLVTTDSVNTGAAPTLIAYDAVTGDEAFRAPYPAGISPAGTTSRQLLGYDAATDEYVLLG